jgi:hypothetical protein
VLRAFMGVTWFSGPGCTTLVGNEVTNSTPAVAGVWHRLRVELPAAPATAVSARVSLVFLQPGAGAQGHFDDVYFGPHLTTPVELQEFSIE